MLGSAHGPGCIHFWLIESPSGRRYSLGTCKKCGATKRFSNWFDNFEFVGRVERAIMKGVSYPKPR